MSTQGQKSRLVDPSISGNGNGGRPASRVYVPTISVEGVGEIMRDFEVVTFYPKNSSYEHSLIKITCPKNKFILGREYRISFDLLPINGS